jgi:hypothetical protein
MWIIVHAFVWLVLLPIVICAAVEWIAFAASVLWTVVAAPFRLIAWGWTLVVEKEPGPAHLQRKDAEMWAGRVRRLEAHLTKNSDS